MATKRRKKADDGKARLRQRLKDLATGAYGPNQPPDFGSEDIGGMAGEMGLDAFARWLGAIRWALLDDGEESYIGPVWMENYDTLEKATDFLWKRGIRP